MPYPSWTNEAVKSTEKGMSLWAYIIRRHLRQELSRLLDGKNLLGIWISGPRRQIRSNDPLPIAVDFGLDLLQKHFVTFWLEHVTEAPLSFQIFLHRQPLVWDLGVHHLAVNILLQMPTP